MLKNILQKLRNVKKTIFLVAISLFFIATLSNATTFTVSGYVKEDGLPVTDATVYLVKMSNGQIFGSCHTSSSGAYVINTTDNKKCQLIAVPDNPNSEYVPTFYPFYEESHRGYVIYPSDMPENLVINPVTDGGEAMIAGGTDVLVQGHVNVLNISGIPSMIYIKNGDRVISHHAINSNGDFSFTAKLNSSSTVLITTLGYKDVNLSYAYNTMASDGTPVWRINVTMESVSGNGSVVTPSSTDKVILSQNYPNPFNPTTNISFSVPNEGLVKVSVFDLSGRMVAGLVNEYKSAGSYSVTFNASELSSGIYYYSIETGSSRITKQMMLIK